MVSIGAPLILVVGLGVAWGVRKGQAMVHQLEDWGNEWEHSAEPVDLHVANFPIISSMYVDGERLGKLENIVLLRQAPGELDSVRLVVSAPNSDLLLHLNDCKLKVDPEAMEGAFPPDGWKQMIRCVSDTEGLVPFGTMVLSNLDRELGLLLAREHLPCDRMHGSSACEDLSQLRDEMRQLKEQIRQDVRQKVRVRVP